MQVSRDELERFTQPLTPEEALGELKAVYDWIASSPWHADEGIQDRQLYAMNAAIELLKAAMVR